jgi:hypothetical protein
MIKADPTRASSSLRPGSSFRYTQGWYPRPVPQKTNRRASRRVHDLLLCLPQPPPRHYFKPAVPTVNHIRPY